MRSLVPLALALALAACADTSSGRSASDDPPPGEPPPGSPPPGSPPSPGRPAPGPQVHELVLPARFATTSQVVAYADFAGGQATDETELVYGLAEGYPRQLTVTPARGYVLPPGCQAGLGPLSWTSLDEVQGTAATLALAGGSLAVELHDEGTVTAVLAGTLGGQQCQAPDGSPLATVALRHRVVLRVKRAAGFVVEQALHQHWPGCQDAIVLPSGGVLWSPVARPVDAAGQPFSPLNAPVAATVTLRSSGALARGSDPTLLVAAPGAVAVSVATALPVTGLKGFEVVDASALTSVDASLRLSRATLKGPMETDIVEGESYPLFHAEDHNGVTLRVNGAGTIHGPLCAIPPASWFASGSPTPAQCEAAVSPAQEFALSSIPVATLRAPGECRLAATVPGTGLRWETRFRTTAPGPQAP